MKRKSQISMSTAMIVREFTPVAESEIEHFSATDAEIVGKLARIIYTQTRALQLVLALDEIDDDGCEYPEDFSQVKLDKKAREQVVQAVTMAAHNTEGEHK